MSEQIDNFLDGGEAADVRQTGKDTITEVRLGGLTFDILVRATVGDRPTAAVVTEAAEVPTNE